MRKETWDGKNSKPINLTGCGEIFAKSENVGSCLTDAFP